jgi:hypothetical protein
MTAFISFVESSEYGRLTLRTYADISEVLSELGTAFMGVLALRRES